MVKIAICAPGKRLKRDRAEAVQALVAGREDVDLSARAYAMGSAYR